MKQNKLVDNLTIEKAIDFLKSKGYSTLKEEDENTKSITLIINTFYSKLSVLYKKLGYDSVIVTPSKTDTLILKKFIESNKQLGIKKEKALDNIETLLNLFFKYYSELGLDNPITNIRFLFKEGFWIIDKVRIIHQKKMEEYRDSFEMEQWFNGLCEQEDDIIRKLRDQRHKEFLGETNNVKKEKE